MFNRAWLAGGIPRTACVAAYEPICAVSLADSYINRANPGTNDAAPGVAPTWSAETGWTFNGSSQYLATGVASNGNYSVLARFSNVNLVNYQTLFGAYNGGENRWYLLPSYQSNHGFGHGGISEGGARLSSGVMGISGRQSYVGGLPDLVVTAWSGTGIGAYIGALNNVGSPTLFGSMKVQALYIYSVPLTPTQVKAVTDAMNMLPMRPQLPRFRSWLAMKRQIPGINKGPFIKGN